MRSPIHVLMCLIVCVANATNPVSAQEPDKATNAKISQRHQLRKQATEFTTAGKFEDASRLLKQLYTLEESIFGPAHEALLETLDEIAQVAALQGDQQAEIDICKRRYRISQQLYGESDYRTQDAQRAIANAQENATRSANDRAQLEQADKLNQGLVKFYGEGKHAAAIPLAKQAAEIYKAILGEQHQDYASSLNNLALLYKSMGDYPRAEPLMVQAMEIRKAVLGEQHPNYASSLNNLASLYKSMGNYARAEPLYVKAMQIKKAALGELHASYATSLNNLAGFYESMGDYPPAEPLYVQAMEIYKVLLGEQHPNYAISLNNLAALYKSMGDYQRAEPLFIQAMEIRKAMLGEQHPSYASSLHSLARLYESMGDYPRAEPLFVKAVEIRKAVLGEQHPSYATSLNNLARLYNSMGEFPRAEPLFVQALEIYKAVLGEQHPSYATSLSNLAALYNSMGDYARAEPLYVQAMEIHKGVLGEEHPSYSNSLNNLAFFYYSTGDYRRAEPLFVQAMEIKQAVLGEQHPEYAISLNNLAEVYNAMGDQLRAEPLLIQSMEIRKAVLGENNPDYARSLNNLAMLYVKRGEYPRAESLFAQVMEIEEAMLGEQHSSYAVSLNNMAFLYKSMGDYPRAEPLLVKVLEIEKTVFAEQHPSYGASLNNLASLYYLMGDYPRAEPLFVRAMEISLRSLEQTASVQTESQQIAMSQSLRYQLDGPIRCGLAMDPQPKAFMQHATDWKGAVFVRLRALRLAAADPAMADTFKSLQSVTQRLSSLSNAIPAQGKRAAWQAQVAELNRQKEILDAQLMRDSVAFRSAQKKVTLDDVREAIPDGGAIVNYLEYNDGKEGRGLVAMVARRDSTPVMVGLGGASDAADAIQRWRETLGADDAARQAGVRLRKQLWEPLLPHLGDASPVFVSTDGVLGQLPFLALPGKADGRFLIEDHAIVMLPVPRLLPQLMQRRASERPTTEPELRTAVLMGDVDYDSAALITPTPEPKKANPPAPLLLASSLRGVRDSEIYAALPATGPEIDAIADLFRASDTVANPPQKIIPLRGRGATETEFRKLAENTRWMHLATHGFFAGADKKNALALFESDREKTGLAMSGQSDDRPRPLVGFSPGRLSGLVFAGANRWSSSDEASPSETLDDGIMTADEIMYLKLENVELAVLSACETGLGETAGGEGILGLQRAFQIAGARTTVTSLWKVDDAATQVLMVEFYRNLLEKKLSKLESLREAQLWLLRNPDVIAGRDLTIRGQIRETKPLTSPTQTDDDTKRSLPAYWAAFQLSGDPR